ncbi:hypothetical protein EKK58_12355 [Candidatus Dependentiae bacterium]|nr:MAG: hypothetical protein EKK58_12355 [Candidatus Dependentiae bacterium]
MSKQQRQTKPATQDTAAAGSAPDTVVTVGDLKFDDPSNVPLTILEGRPDSAPTTSKKARSEKPPKGTDAAEIPAGETIHASECVVNSECTLTPNCRGRLRATNAISGRVQIYCPKCGKFAAGTRPANALVSGSGAKLFDRVAGK